MEFWVPFSLLIYPNLIMLVLVSSMMCRELVHPINVAVMHQWHEIINTPKQSTDFRLFSTV
jgi:hypothetical protein